MVRGRSLWLIMHFSGHFLNWRQQLNQSRIISDASSSFSFFFSRPNADWLCFGTNALILCNYSAWQERRQLDNDGACWRCCQHQTCAMSLSPRAPVIFITDIHPHHIHNPFFLPFFLFFKPDCHWLAFVSRSAQVRGVASRYYQQRN